MGEDAGSWALYAPLFSGNLISVMLRCALGKEMKSEQQEFWSLPNDFGEACNVTSLFCAFVLEKLSEVTVYWKLQFPVFCTYLGIMYIPALNDGKNNQEKFLNAFLKCEYPCS